MNADVHEHVSSGSKVLPLQVADRVGIPEFPSAPNWREHSRQGQLGSQVSPSQGYDFLRAS